MRRLLHNIAKEVKSRVRGPYWAGWPKGQGHHISSQHHQDLALSQRPSASMQEAAAASLHYVLLDDDALIRLGWEVAAREACVSLFSFATPEELLGAVEKIPKNSIFYIDAILANGERGEDVAKELFDRGFREIYLATNLSFDSSRNLSWIKGTQGKQPPF